MSYKVEKQVFLNSEVQPVGAVVDIDDNDLAATLLKSGTISNQDSSQAPATATPAEPKADEVLNEPAPLAVIETPVTTAQPTPEQIAQDLASVETPNNIQLS